MRTTSTGRRAHEPGAAPHRLHRGEVLPDEHRPGEAEQRERDEPGDDREQQAADHRDEPQDARERRAGPTAGRRRPSAARGVALARGATRRTRGRGGPRRRSTRARSMPLATTDRGRHEQSASTRVAADLDVQEPERVDDRERHQHRRGDADHHRARARGRARHASRYTVRARGRAISTSAPDMRRASVVSRGPGCTVGAMADDPLPPLDAATVDPEPMAQFARWYDAAVTATGDRAAAMTVATATPDGRPSARVVLLRGFDARGLVFFTNYDSRKGGELAANARGGRRALLERARRADPRRGRRRARGRRGVGRVLRAPTARPPHRRVGVAPERAGGRPRHARGAGRRGRGALPRRRAAAAALGRVPDRARDGGVLAQPRRSCARPRGVRTAGRRVADPSPQSVSTPPGLGRRPASHGARRRATRDRSDTSPIVARCTRSPPGCSSRPG